MPVGRLRCMQMYILNSWANKNAQSAVPYSCLDSKTFFVKSGSPQELSAVDASNFLRSSPAEMSSLAALISEKNRQLPGGQLGMSSERLSVAFGSAQRFFWMYVSSSTLPELADESTIESWPPRS